MDESQGNSTGTHAGHPGEIVMGRSHVTINPPPQVTQSPVSNGTPARVSVEVCDEYERRICDLETQVEALSKELESVIMRERETAEAFKRSFLDVVGTFNKQFGWKMKP